MEVGLCDRFPALTPIGLRREKAREVLLLVKRYNIFARKQKKTKGGKKIVRRPASDTWF